MVAIFFREMDSRESIYKSGVHTIWRLLMGQKPNYIADSSF